MKDEVRQMPGAKRRTSSSFIPQPSAFRLSFSVSPWWSFAALATLVATQGCYRAEYCEAYVRAPPLIWWTRETDSEGNVRREVRNFLGFLYHQSHEAAASDDGKPLGRTRAVHFMWPLGESSARDLPDGRTKRVFRLVPAAWITKRSEPSGAGYDYYQLRVNVLGPIFSLSADNYGEGYVKAHILWPLGQYFRGEKRVGAELRKFHSFRLLPIVHYERNWRPGRVPLRGGQGHGTDEREIRLDERGTFRFLHFLLGLEHEARRGVTRIYLVGGSARDKKTGRSCVAALWGAERGPSTDREHQLLWRFFVLKRSGAPTVPIRSSIAGVRATEGHGAEDEHRRMKDEEGALLQPSSLRLRSSHASPVATKPSDTWRLVQWMFHGSPRVTGNVGPVLSYESDWEADTKRVSVLAGLFSYERVGLRKSGRILWFIPWRGREPEPIAPGRHDNGL